MDKTLETISSLSEKEQKIAAGILERYSDVGGNSEMLKSAFAVWNRLSDHIWHIPANEQLSIIHEATMIAYEARIEAFDHMADFDTEKEQPKYSKVIICGTGGSLKDADAEMKNAIKELEGTIPVVVVSSGLPSLNTKLTTVSLDKYTPAPKKSKKYKGHERPYKFHR